MEPLNKEQYIIAIPMWKRWSWKLSETVWCALEHDFKTIKLGISLDLVAKALIVDFLIFQLAFWMINKNTEECE